MFGILIVCHIVTAVCIIGLVLLQHGKGAQTGAVFGSGASTTVFGSQGSGNFLSRTTATLVAIFFAINLSLAFLTNKMTSKSLSAVVPSESIEQTTVDTAPQSTSDIANDSDVPE